VIPVVDQEPINGYNPDGAERESTAINDLTEDTNPEDEKASLDSQEMGQKEE
tara:strand:- start:2250 stop:2405 length:156 start_codon:yes stop_codon:yes gene_type:complete